ncbi:MAG TPA: tetratricopeptide repeat protein [Kofleriaceae bacterium]|nr:tetratricopeptide repeat protein [Kofleriaceae bacterium]
MSIEERQIERLLELSDRLRSLSDWDGAIDALKRALALDPDHARAHAALALALLGARRLQGASIEARLALASDGGDPFCHHAAAAVLCAERKLDDAWAHCLVALEVESADVDVYVLGAHIRELQGRLDLARELLERALELEPVHVGALTALAEVELADGAIDRATARVDEALAAEPGSVDAHVIAGFVALRRGDVAGAEEHARFALGEDAADHGALRLYTAVKARRSWTMGLWWRFNSWLTLRSQRGQIAILLGSFVLIQLATIVAEAVGADDVAGALDLLWLGFCAYTWVAPFMFRRMLQRDLEKIVLRDDF